MPAPNQPAGPAAAPYEEFVRLLVAHEAHLRGFLRALLPAWDDVDEVMQQTSLVAWRKFSQFERGTNFMAWAAAIARFEALKHLRARSRDRLVFSPEVLDLIADEAAAEPEALGRERTALESCLGKLDAMSRELLRLSYQPGAKFHEVAAQAGKSVQGYYKTIQRLRARLLDCIRAELKEDLA